MFYLQGSAVELFVTTHTVGWYTSNSNVLQHKWEESGVSHSISYISLKDVQF